VSKLSVPIIAAVAALALAACGGGSSKVSTSGAAATTTTTTAPGGGRGFQNAAFTTCLKQHGVTLPAFAGGGQGRPRGGSGRRGFGGFGGRGGSGGRGGFLGGAGLSTQQRAAFSACQSKLPGGGRFGGRGFAGGATASQLKAYMSCLGDNGVKVPATATMPGSAAGGSGPRRFGNPIAGLRKDPHFAAASAKCAPLLPTRGSGTPASAG
jgi:hypothetical protein